MGERYTHGHHESVLRSHVWRTAENSAGHLLPHLQSGHDVLDVGCGPGTITRDLARIVAPGRVLGIDSSAEVIAQASAEGGAEFAVGDAYRLDLEDESFDVVHVHQVLHHLTDPVGALTELRRVLRRGGLLAVRETDYGGYFWAPVSAALERWMELYHLITERNGADADAGRRLPSWVRQAEFEDVKVSSSTWTFADPEERAWWGGSWADRVRLSSYASQAVEYGLSTAAELDDLAESWREWADTPDAMFVVAHVEVLARRP